MPQQLMTYRTWDWGGIWNYLAGYLQAGWYVKEAKIIEHKEPGNIGQEFLFILLKDDDKSPERWKHGC